MSNQQFLDFQGNNQFHQSQDVFEGVIPKSLGVNQSTSTLFLEKSSIPQLPLLKTDHLPATFGAVENSPLPILENPFVHSGGESWQLDTTAPIDILLQETSKLARQEIAQFFQQPDWVEQLSLAFGEGFNQETTKNYLEQLPTIEVVSDGALGQAKGAFSISRNTIFLSYGLIERANWAEIVAVLIEELGHGIDAHINQQDSAGDEGEIFSRLVAGLDSAKFSAGREILG